MKSSILALRAALCIVAFMSTARAQTPGQKTWCNPVDIGYRYSIEKAKAGISYRSGADPVIVRDRTGYTLFVTNSSGWWHSRDLLHWDFVKPSVWPAEDMCAPAALSVRDTLYLFESTFDPRPIYFTTSPVSGDLRLFNPLLPPMPGALGPWDPDIFHDGPSDRWYMYFGSSNLYPISVLSNEQRRREF